MRRYPQQRGSRGFTLVEVLIGVVILALIGSALGQASWLVTKGKRKVEDRQLMYHKVRVALQRMRTDIAMAFLAKPLLSPAGQDLSPWKTAFLGEDETLSLTTLSGRRMVAGMIAADQREVGYALADLADDAHRENPQAIYPSGARQLMRREDPVLDDRVEEGGDAQLLLEGMLALHFDYYDRKKAEWTTAWDSTALEHLNQLPRAVRVTITVPHALDPEKKATFQTIALLGLGPDPMEIP